MRRFIFILSLCLVAWIIKIDLQQGTLPYASFYNDTVSCEQRTVIQTVMVQIQPADTIYTLFSATSSPEPFSFTERLAAFYQANPHLQKQPLLAGEKIKIPIKKINNRCERS